MKMKRLIYNIFSSVGSQIVILLLGFIIPRVTMANYGSETNGFVNMTTQVYAYLGLLEAGTATAAVQALYGPIAHNDKNAISGIISATNVYYRRITKYYAVAVCIMAVLIPWLVDSSLNRIEMMLYFLFFGISNIINFWFTAAMRPLLLAEGKNYIYNNVNLVFQLLSKVVKIILLYLGVNIVVLQLVYAIVNVFQIVVYMLYYNRNYKWIDKSVPPILGALQQKSAFLLQQVSNLIFNCTDIVLLSMFCDFKVASVYSVYLLIYNAVSTVLHHLCTSAEYLLGQTYNKDKEKHLLFHRLYESVYLSGAFVIYSTVYVSTIPFIRIYTSDIVDTNYIDLLLPLLFCICGLLTACKSIYMSLINRAYHAKKTINRTVFEAILNLVLSFLWVHNYGLRGVLIGTGVASCYRVIDMIFYSNKTILQSSVWPTIKVIGINFGLFLAVAYTNRLAPVEILGYGDLFVYAIVVGAKFALQYFFVNIAINIKIYFSLLRKIRKRKRENGK